jgi:predicted outer membrane lipoprotein
VSATAIVTLAVGARHRSLWNAHCKRNWEIYAARHGYDVICVDEPIDRSPRASARSPTWQKCLILGEPFARRYERIVWMDSDVLINPAAPPLVEGVPLERVGAVDEYATPSRELYRQSLEKLYRHWEAIGVSFNRNETAAEFYAAFGLPDRHDEVVQPGVLVLSPRHHRELLEHVYHAYEERGGDLWGEWRPLSFELLEAGAVEWLDHRFNYPWPIYKAQHFPFLLNHPDHPRAREAATAALNDVHCLHFAGSHDEIGLIEPDGDSKTERPRPRPAPAPPAGGPRLDTPVALLVFARPDTTRQVLEAVRVARPRRLLVIADAPPEHRPDLDDGCAAVRRLIDEIDWDCEVLTNYAEHHMGLNRRLATGLDWVFEQVEEAIVLEDDCVPEPTFFRFCAEALEHHRHDAQITTISGSSFDFAPETEIERRSYRYSRYPLIWGWATWRRAWRAHDQRMTSWPALRDSRWLERILDDPHELAYWTSRFGQAHRGEGSWDHAWVLTSWLAGAFAVIPAVNLVTNVGFRADATNTRENQLSPYANMATAPMRFPLTHPRRAIRDAVADRFIEETVFSGNVGRMFDRLRATRANRAPAPL